MCPLTVEHFESLCTGDNKFGANGEPYHFKGKMFDYIKPNIMAQTSSCAIPTLHGSELIYTLNFSDVFF